MGLRIARKKSAGAESVKSLPRLSEAKSLDAAWKRLEKDDQYQEWIHGNYHQTRCHTTASILAHHLTEVSKAEGVEATSGVHAPFQHGIARFKHMVDHGDARFYRCYIYLIPVTGGPPVSDHTFIIEARGKDRFRVHQSYICAYTLEQQLAQTAYGSLDGGDLTREELDQHLDRIERLSTEDWTPKHRRLYRECFHASPSITASRSHFSFYASDGKSALMFAVESGDTAAVKKLLKMSAKRS